LSLLYGEVFQSYFKYVVMHLLPAGLRMIALVCIFSLYSCWFHCIVELRLTLGEGFVRERLLCMDDLNYGFTYEIIEGTLPVRGYVAGVRLHRITERNRTFAEWWADFEVVGADRDAAIRLIGNNVFAAGFKAVAAKLAGPGWVAEKTRPESFAAHALNLALGVPGSPKSRLLPPGGKRHDLVRMGVLEGPDQDRVYHTENGGIGATNTESQRDDHNGREPRALLQLAKPISQILHQSSHWVFILRCASERAMSYS
jgi:hypothetical protein